MIERYGIGASPGIAIGAALLLQTRDLCVFQLSIGEDEVSTELRRLEQAIEGAKSQLLELKGDIERDLGREHAYIFDAQLHMLDDAMLVDATKEKIRKELVNAEWAVSQTILSIKEEFEHIGEHFFQQQGGDIDDVATRILGNLFGDHAHDLSELKEECVLVAHKLTPSETARLHRGNVIALVTDVGGATSHTAIIAEALGIPAVVGTHDFSQHIQDGATILVDGSEGVVIVDPTDEIRQKYERRRKAFRREEEELQRLKDLPAETMDGHRIALRSNIELPQEVSRVLEHGSEGIGLYRSEFLYLDTAPVLPEEEHHFALYRTLAESLPGQPIVIRTLDLGGEKYFHEVLDPQRELEGNPVLGLRGIRYCLKERSIFKTQLRAILRAGHYGDLSIMFPMISRVEEFRDAKAVVIEAMAELDTEGLEFCREIPIGVMIEVPSAAATADILAREVDFFSIGTNDLIQYSLAIERGNENVAYLYQPFHPGIVRQLDFIIRSGKEAGIPVAVCGEIATNPVYAFILVGLGVSELSMNPVAIPAVKRMIRNITREAAQDCAEDIRDLSTASEIESYLNERLPMVLPPAIGGKDPLFPLTERQRGEQ